MEDKYEQYNTKKIHNQSMGSSEEREEVESSEKDKPCLTKMMTPPLASVTSVDKIPDGEWASSARRGENPGIRKEEDKLRLDFWMQIRLTK